MKKKIISVLLVFVFIFTLIPLNDVYAAGAIPKGAKEYKDNYYYVYTEKMSWESAKETCESLGGHLAVITSASEWNFAKKLISESDSHCWLGGYYSESNAWKWITGDAWKFTDWTNSYFYESIGYYLSSPGDIWTSDNDVYNFYYLCEWEAEDVDTRLPLKAVISSVKKASGTSVTITWKTVNDAEGYSVYMKTGVDGKYAKIADINEADITTYMQNDLSKGNTYYYRVRAYKTVYGEKSYGELSKSKKITIK